MSEINFKAEMVFMLARNLYFRDKVKYFDSNTFVISTTQHNNLCPTLFYRHGEQYNNKNDINTEIKRYLSH